jgi:hypothetical protein
MIEQFTECPVIPAPHCEVLIVAKSKTKGHSEKKFQNPSPWLSFAETIRRLSQFVSASPWDVHPPAYGNWKAAAEVR